MCLDTIVHQLKTYINHGVPELQLDIRTCCEGATYTKPIFVTTDIANRLLCEIEAEQVRCHSRLVRLLTAGDDDAID